MFRVLMIACFVPDLVNSIIVNDPPLKETDYKYSYNIEDPITGDMKSQYEAKRGDVVRGEYTVNDPNGIRRTVEYTADGINGFTATVREEPLSQFSTNVQSVSYPISKSVFEVIKEAQNVMRTGPVTYDEDNEMRYFMPSNEIQGDNVNEFYYGKYFIPS